MLGFPSCSDIQCWRVFGASEPVGWPERESRHAVRSTLGTVLGRGFLIAGKTGVGLAHRVGSFRLLALYGASAICRDLGEIQ